MRVCALPRGLQGREVDTGVGVDFSGPMLGCEARRVQIAVRVNVFCGFAGLILGLKGIFGAARVVCGLEWMRLACLVDGLSGWCGLARHLM